MKSKYIILLLTILIAKVAYTADSNHNVVPIEGYVPSSDVAIKIAVAVWEPIYGKENIKKQYPYKAYLLNDKWFVEGSLALPIGRIDDFGNKVKTVTIGGVAEAEISKKTGQILRVSHGE